GNLVNRVLTFTYRNYDGRVPEPGPLDQADRTILQSAEAAIAAVGESLSLCQFKNAIGVCLSLAQRANRYLDEKAPWKAIKEDRRRAATSLYVAIGVINALKVALYPFLPFTCGRLHGYLGYSGTIEEAGWRFDH